jgi:hypothetical protein
MLWIIVLLWWLALWAGCCSVLLMLLPKGSRQSKCQWVRWSEAVVQMLWIIFLLWWLLLWAGCSELLSTGSRHSRSYLWSEAVFQCCG